MGMPAARMGDMHVCPMITPGVPPIPHVGGPIVKGQPNVLTGKMPQARISDMCVCVGPPDIIVMGAMNVLVGGMPAARLGDSTAHGGTIVVGMPTVLIGMSAGGGGGGGGGGGFGGAPGAGSGSGSASGSTDPTDERGEPGGPMTNHSGAVSTGETMQSEAAAQAEALQNASNDAAPFCEVCAQARAAAAARAAGQSSSA